MRTTRLAPSIIACWVLAGRHLSLRSLVTDSLLGIYAHFIASPIFSMFLAGSILGIIVSRPCRHDDERDPSSRATELEGESEADTSDSARHWTRPCGHRHLLLELARQ